MRPLKCAYVVALDGALPLDGCALEGCHLTRWFGGSTLFSPLPHHRLQDQYSGRTSDSVHRQSGVTFRRATETASHSVLMARQSSVFRKLAERVIVVVVVQTR